MHKDNAYLPVGPRYLLKPWNTAHWNVTDVGGDVDFAGFDNGRKVALFKGSGEFEGEELEVEFTCGVDTKLLPVMHRWDKRVWTLQTPAVCGKADFDELKAKIALLEGGARGRGNSASLEL